MEQGPPQSMFRAPSHARTREFLRAVIERQVIPGNGMNGPWVRAAAQFPYLLDTLLLGVKITVIVTLGGFALSVVLGLGGALLRTSRFGVLRAAGTLYVDVFRAVPVLTQLFIIYFGLAEIGREAAAGTGGDHRLRNQWRGVSDRGVPRRDRGGASGTDRGGAVDRDDAAAGDYASSCCRRRCG